MLKLLQDKPGMTQRAIAKEVGLNVSSINSCLKTMLEKGWVKVSNVSISANKLSYPYRLTPTGVAAKAALAPQFLQRKMAEYDKLREEIEALQQDKNRPDHP